jgi:hypothetical protein
VSKPYRLFHVAKPEHRVELIARQIRRAVRGPTMPEFRKLVVREMIDGCASRDEPCELRGIFEWWKRIKFLPDPIGVDLYPTPLETLDIGAEDCDGHVIGVGSSLAIAGYHVGVRVIQSAKGEWHVYGLAGYPRAAPAEWVPMDTTWEQAEGPGDEYPEDQCRYRRSWVLNLRG